MTLLPVFHRCGLLLQFAFLFGVLLAPALLLSQPVDSKGSSFWIVFIESAGNADVIDPPDLRLYLSADYQVDADVVYYGTNEAKSVSIPTPFTSVEFNVNDAFGPGVELTAKDTGISPHALQVIVDEEVSDANLAVNGVTTRMRSSDAFLAFPEDALGREYVVLSYPNGYNDISTNGFDHPSEFAVIAVEDGTDVAITPSCRINGKSTTESFIITLKKGEVFFAQADLLRKNDVSGTRIYTNKPVAVFAGNRRTAVPTEVGNYRDHLVEQLLPLDRWGTEAIIPPFYAITPGVVYSPVARVIADVPDLRWSINGQPQPPLKEREVVEIPLKEEPMVIAADGPIQVAAYEHSVGVQSSGQFHPGDPFMMLIPSPEQYDSLYVFQSVSHELFTRHFINVVIPLEAETSLRLDGAALGQPLIPIAGTEYAYAQVEVAAGSHTIRADAPFGLMVYGYGAANSYGYIGGMKLPKAPSGVEDEAPSLAGFSLQAFPQPVRGNVGTVKLTLPRRMRLSLELYRVNGEKVSNVRSMEWFEEGGHEIPIEMAGLANGLYLCRGVGEKGESVVAEIVLER